jgi:hypothetical protein
MLLSITATTVIDKINQIADIWVEKNNMQEEI